MWKLIFSDEVTSGWPYPRLLKLRKWLLLASFFVIAWAHYRLREPAIESLLGGVLAIDRTVLAGVLLTPWALLLVQWLILLGQHLLSADVVFADRIAALKSDRVKGLTEQLANADQLVTDALEARNEIQRKMSDNEEIVRHGLRFNERGRNLQGAALRTHARDLVNTGSFADDENPQFRLALSDLFVGEKSLEKADQRADEVERNRENVHLAHRTAIADDPTSRRGFLAMEVVLDVVRLAPTTILAMLAFAQVLEAGVPW